MRIAGLILLLLFASACGDVDNDIQRDASVTPAGDASGEAISDALALPDSYGCAGVSTGMACSKEGASCSREGQPGCDSGPPPGGSCKCKGGKWACWSICHSTCPSSYAPSMPGSACTFTDTEGVCNYMNGPGGSQITCSCKNGKYSCT